MAHAVARDAFWDQAEEQEANTGGTTGRRPTACSTAVRPRAEPLERPDNATWTSHNLCQTEEYSRKGTRKVGDPQDSGRNHSTPRRSQGTPRSTARRQRKERPPPLPRRQARARAQPQQTPKRPRGPKRNGMPAGHPLQRLASCTGHKEFDDAFWAIMDWQSEDEHKEKKAVQKSTSRRGTFQGRAPTTRTRARRHPSVFRGLDPRKVGAAVAEPGVAASASTSSSSGGRGDPQEQGDPCRQGTQRDQWGTKCDTSATWLGARNHTAGRTCGTTARREARQQPSWGTRTTDDEDRHQDGQVGTKNMDKVSTI